MLSTASSKPTRTFSCAECRRLKLKCSRQWPCNECVRRGTRHLCPNGTLQHGPSKASQIAQLHERINQLEELLERQTAATSPSSFPQGLRSIEQQETSQQVSGLASSKDHVGQLIRKTGGPSRFFGVTAAEHRLATEDEDVEQRINASTGEPEWPLGSLLPSSIRTRVRSLMDSLPSRSDALLSVERYWEFTLWRFEPFTKVFFNPAIEEVYPLDSDDAPIPHPHRLALVFAVLALSELFDPASTSSGISVTYYTCARSALMAGHFLTDVSVTSLCTVQLICGYILNAEGPLDDLYVLVGLGIRLATSAGFHRDGSWWNIEQPELDDRRRVWWELTQLERVHSLTLGLPMTLPTGCDTAKPSSLSPISFLWWKWDLMVLISKVNENANLSDTKNYDAASEIKGSSSRDHVVILMHADVIGADRDMRNYDASIPEHLRCKSIPLWRLKPGATEQDRSSSSAYEQDQIVGDDGLPLLLRVQQLRLAQLYNMSMFHLHRPSFAVSLVSDPLKGTTAPSVTALLVEISGNIINLVSALFQIAPGFVHFGSNSLELFNCLACHAAVIIRQPKCALKDYCGQQIDLALQLIDQIHTEKPSHRIEMLIRKSKKLKQEAKMSLSKAESELDLAASWDNTAPPWEPALSQNSDTGISDVDFDNWLSQILRGENV